MNGWSRLAAGLLLTPALVTLALVTLPRLQTSPALADFVAFAGAAGVALAALALSAPAEASRKAALGVAVGAALALGVVALLRASNGAALVCVDAALIALAWALGGSLGRSVQHPAHLFPACVVAASMDVVSLLSPEGPSHAVAESERALSVLAIWFPVPGSPAVSPALGVGDLLFIAFALGAACAHQLPYARAIACCALGVAVAGLAAALFHVAVPALVPIALCVVLGLPSVRRLRPADRGAAHWSMLIAGSLALVTIARSVLKF